MSAGPAFRFMGIRVTALPALAPRRLAWLAGLAAAVAVQLDVSHPPAAEATANPDRSPVDFTFTPDGRFLITANQTADTVSLVRLDTGAIAGEVHVSRRPQSLTFSPDGRRLLVTTRYG